MLIDENTQAKLRKRFNPDGSDLRNMQLRMLEMLKYIDNICHKNNIKYWLSSGTCLGAVRHGGFIPWDDDVDIEMLKPDYDKLKKVILADTNCPYDWQDESTDEFYPFPFAKLRDRKSIIDEGTNLSKKYRYRGLFIDIFILTPSNSYWLRRICTSLYCRFIKWSIMQKNNKLKNKKIITKIFSFLESFQKIHSKGRLRHITGSPFILYREQNSIRTTKRVMFENYMFPIPIDYDSYLSKIYGDYNNIPSDLESQHRHMLKCNFV